MHSLICFLCYHYQKRSINLPIIMHVIVAVSLFNIMLCVIAIIQMTFHFSHTVPMGLLFRSWTIQSVGGKFYLYIVCRSSQLCKITLLQIWLEQWWLGSF